MQLACTSSLLTTKYTTSPASHQRPKAATEASARIKTRRQGLSLPVHVSSANQVLLFWALLDCNINISNSKWSVSCTSVFTRRNKRSERSRTRRSQMYHILLHTCRTWKSHDYLHVGQKTTPEARSYAR